MWVCIVRVVLCWIQISHLRMRVSQWAMQQAVHSNCSYFGTSLTVYCSPSRSWITALLCRCLSKPNISRCCCCCFTLKELDQQIAWIHLPNRCVEQCVGRREVGVNSDRSSVSQANTSVDQLLIRQWAVWLTGTNLQLLSELTSFTVSRSAHRHH